MSNPASVLAAEQAKAKREALELAMLQQLRALQLDDGLQREHVFHPTRKWRFDFAWPGEHLALEVEGGTHTNGRHVRGTGYEADCRKYAEAVLGGWSVLRATADQVRSGVAVAWVMRARGRRGDKRTPYGQGLRPRLEAFYVANPLSDLTAEQVAIKFDVDLRHARNELAIAVKGGLLKRETVWRLNRDPIE